MNTATLHTPFVNMMVLRVDGGLIIFALKLAKKVASLTRPSVHRFDAKEYKRNHPVLLKHQKLWQAAFNDRLRTTRRKSCHKLFLIAEIFLSLLS